MSGSVPRRSVQSVPQRWGRWVSLAIVSLLLHAWILDIRVSFPLADVTPKAEAEQIMRVVVMRPSRAPSTPDDEVVEEEDEAEEVAEEDPPREEPTGQIVETPPPVVEKTPETAEYLAEHDNAVPEETRTDAFKINPEVVAPQFSEETQVAAEELIDLQATEPSDGATPGGASTPGRDGAILGPSSPFAVTNKLGTGAPAPASATSSQLAGAPQNDLLREKLGSQVALNTKEYLFADYLNRIRRLVNFYWEQNLDNLPSSVTFSKSSYTTGVDVVLDGNGALEVIEVVEESGVSELDDCVVRAFKLAGPFPTPPAGLIEKDGRVYLPEMDFTLTLGQARAQYQGVDPRSGVMFPGILKSPR